MRELWHLDKIKELDFPSPTGFMKVEEFLPKAIEEVTQDISTQYAILRKSMKEQGQLVPLHITRDRKRLRDGIHRIAIATGLDWNYMVVSTQRHETEWDNTPEGQKYWQLWNWRLRGFNYGNI